MQYTALLALSGLAPAAAHMIMKTPAPYGAASLNNSPLDASGSDYPCKQRPGVYEAPATKNTMAIGAPQTLSFTGSAVHGGGSCQVAITKDLKPTKDSKFGVILSIEGGCPANVDGNLGADPSGSGASTFKYSIPEGIAPGEYTLAWTWFNKVGNREMYMNCAPITVTGGAGKRDLNDTIIPGVDDVVFEKRDLSSLPDLFKANIKSVSGDCTTTASKDLVFPNPGKNVIKAGKPADLGPPVGSCASASSASSGSSGSGAADSGAAGSASAGSGSSSGSAGAGAGSTGSGAAGSGAGSTGSGATDSAGAGAGSTGSGAADSAGSGSAGSSSAGSGSMGGAAAASPSPAGDASIPIVSLPAGGSQGGAASAPAAAPSVPAAAPSVPEAAPSAPAAIPSAPAAPAAVPSAPVAPAAPPATGGSGCGSPGALVCSADGTMFGICTGSSALMRPVAAGTKCVGGAIAHAKRSAKFAKAYNA